MLRLFGLLLVAAGLAAIVGDAFGVLPQVTDLYQPAGMVSIVVGAVIVLFGRRRRKTAEAVDPPSHTSSIGYRRPKETRSKPPRKYRWGRDG